MKYRDVRRLLRIEGWQLVRQRGSHQIWKHPEKATFLVIAGADGDDVSPGAISAIMKEMGWKN